jgi:ABC-2 type transport system permease protein
MTRFVAIVGAEVKRQLTSPVNWLVVGLFALLAGGAFVINLNAFLDASVEALSAPPSRPVNVNQLLIRPYLAQVGIAALLVLPVLTARAYSGRRRPTLPFVLAPFIGVLAMYAVMLAASLTLVVLLFLQGAPEGGPIVSGYLGLLLIGAAFIAVALFISSLATSAIPAALATFAIALALAASTWLARSAAAGARPAFRVLSIGAAFDDFAKGVIDAGHIVTCLTIVAAALFLTAHTLEPDEPAP